MKLGTTKRLFLILLGGVILFGFAITASAGTMWVDTNDDAENCDGVLSLREAIDIAQGNRQVINNAEYNQITDSSGMGITLWPPTAPPPAGCSPLAGPFWYITTARNAFNTINFSSGTGTLFLTSPLSILQYSEGEINGKNFDGNIVTIDGRAAGTNADGISLGNHRFNILNLEIRNFSGDGLKCDSCDSSVFRGLNIHNNGGNGIHLISSSSTYGNPQNDTIGGAASDQGNMIFSNLGDGINITADLNFDRNNENIQILNNRIGTADGVTAAGNHGRGITLRNTFGVTVGDASGVTKNIISGNLNDGIAFEGSGAVSNLVIWNNIGTDLSGAARLGNSASGVSFLSDAGDGVNFSNSFPNRIGLPGLPNVISANNYGIFIADTNTSNNIIQSNLIGTNQGGNADLGNNADGVYFVNGTYDNQVGGTGVGEGNLIAFNAVGIHAASGVRNGFRQNRIFLNRGLGIDLAPDGVTPNDPADVDSGPNNLQNFPVITFVNVTLSSVNIQGTFNGTPSHTMTLEFFGNGSVDPTGYGEGQFFLGSTQVTTTGGGNAAFNVSFAVDPGQVGQWVTATATDNTNNTSEYSLAHNICADLSITPPSIISFNNGGSGNFTVNTSVGCSFTVQSTVPWLQTSYLGGSSIGYNIFPDAGPNRNGTINVFFNIGNFQTFTNFTVFQSGGARKAPFDFDGDGRSDMSIFRPSTGQWWVLKSSNGANYVTQFGLSTDKLVAADFTGDGVADIAYWRPSNGTWFVLRSDDSTFFSFPFGANGDIPMPADYDGDGKADAAVYRPSTATWYINRSGGGTTIQQFGLSTDLPVAADYDGDGKADIAVFRPTGTNGAEWWIMKSTGGTFATQFGLSTDRAVPGDYTGDGKADIAFWRPSNGNWYIFRSENQQYYAFPFGTAGDSPVPADYDGDGKIDAAVFRPSTSTWYLNRSTSGIQIQGFGTTGDLAVPNEFVR